MGIQSAVSSLMSRSFQVEPRREPALVYGPSSQTNDNPEDAEGFSTSISLIKTSYSKL